MKLSQILIESEGKRVQTRYQLVDIDYYQTKAEISKYCAIGAVGCELGLIRDDNCINLSQYTIIDTINKKFKLEDKRLKCPADTEEYAATITTIIIHLNDAHGWTFKQIGEWLQSIGY